MKYSSFTMKGFKKRSWIIGICTILLIFALLFYFFTGDDQQKKKRQREECHNIIHIAAAQAASSAAVMAQAPGVDNLALAWLVGQMTMDLAKVFDINLKDSIEVIGKNVLVQFGSATASRYASQWIAGWIPFAGNALNAATMTALVEYIGWEVVKNLEVMKDLISMKE